MIKGNLTCLVSRKNFKFEMSPSTKKTNIDVKAELQRLYFNFKKDKNGKECLHLQTKDSIEEAERVKSFLIELKGGLTKKVAIGIEIVQSRDVFKASLRVKDIPVSMSISLKLANLHFGRSNYSHIQLASYVKDKMALVQK